jgi:hypothetical protein
MLMRSHNPIHGVGRLAWTRGASQKVNAPNATRTTMVHLLYLRDRSADQVRTENVCRRSGAMSQIGRRKSPSRQGFFRWR